MFLWLWQNIRGYVLIEVTGFSVERFLNLAVHRGIYVWDVVHAENSVYMKVSIKGFKMLKACARKTKCRIKIAAKHGYPFVAHRYRKRKILAGGLFFFIGILYFLSTFLWLVEIKGNNRLGADELLGFCAEQGMKPGVFKYGIKTKELENKMLDHFSDISWISIHIKGTRATVSVAEIVPMQEIVDRDTPCNIVAKKDGLITSIVTGTGTPLVKENDVVKKGDVLVSGELVIKADEEVIRREYVRASAQIRARMYTDININVPFSYTEKAHTGQEKSDHALILFGENINFIKVNTKFENYDKITARKQLSIGEDYPLPLIIVTDKYREFTTVQKTRDVSQAKELAEKMVASRIIREFDFEADIMGTKLSFNQNNDGIDVRAEITTDERIDMAEGFTPEPQDIQEEVSGAYDYEAAETWIEPGP